MHENIKIIRKIRCDVEKNTSIKYNGGYDEEKDLNYN